MGILRTDKISGLETPTAVTGSVSFDGTGDYLSTPDTSQFDFEAGNWTVEGWIYMNSLPSSGSRYTLAAKWLETGNNYSWICSIYNDSGNMELNFSYTTNGSTATNLFSNGGPAEAGKWYHIAFVRDSNTLRQFVNGVQLSTNSISGTIYNGTADVNIGRHNGDTNYMNGYISNLRILKGTALYTADFTVPTHELEVIKDTVLLACNNPDSVTAASYAGIGTSVTLTATGNVSVASTVPGLTRDFTFGTQFEGVSKFDTQGYFVPPSGTTEQRGRGRGLFGGGNNPAVNTIFYVDIATQGNAQEFGDLTIDSGWGRLGCSSATRGLFAGGYVNTPAATFYNVIQYVTIATTGNSNDFGDLNNPIYRPLTCSSSTRGLFAGGYVGPAFPTTTNVIDYVTIAALGNATDFGDLISTAQRNNTGFSSPTRGIFGQTNISPTTNGIEFVTIATTGNAQDFGDTTTTTRNNIAGASSSVRGVFAGGDTPALFNTIDYVTIATTGNAQDFGDLIEARAAAAGASNSIRAVIAGGINPSNSNTIEFITFTSTGNAQDFGDLISARRDSGGCSDSHGGLS